MVKVILDPGSCHMGKLEYAKELIDLAAEVEAYAIKFQLFEGNNNNNIELPRKWWPELVKYARGKIDIFASAFDEEAIQLLYDTGIKRVKFAYSQAFNLKLIRKARKLGMEIWASGDLKNYPSYADIKFFCIPEYPVKSHDPFTSYSYEFDGFSSHIMGIEKDIEIMRKTEYIYIEKHFTLDHDDINCPDHWIALIPKELKELCKYLKK